MVYVLGYTGLLCEKDIDECATIRSACGVKGLCFNIPGNYRCDCEEEGMCGHYCNLRDPCLMNNSCVHGTCQSNCSDVSDYVCVCDEGYTGKNCDENAVSKILTSFV